MRSALLDRLHASDGARVITVVAPAGYGKTTLISQLIDRETRPAACLTVSRNHNDPAQLLRAIAEQLVQAAILPPEARDQLEFNSSTALPVGAPALASALAGSPSGVLALDQLEALRSTGSRDVLAELAIRLPPTLTLVVASRSAVPIPIASMRVHGDVLELSADDLALSMDEARDLASDLSIRINDVELGAAVQHTEGWPAGFYLTLLAARSGVAPSSLAEIGGDETFISQYLRSEVFKKLTPARKTFLLHTSILDEVSGQACDFILERTDSYRVLESLASSSLFVTPIDRQGKRYRYHNLLREFLHAELEHRDPKADARLHLRAAEWYEKHDMPIEAVYHAMEADDVDHVARLVATFARTVFSEGRRSTTDDWIHWFDTADRLDHHPEIALLAALMSAQSGDEVGVERWMAFVDRARGRLGPMTPIVRIADALFCREGVDQSLIDARKARDELTPASNWYATSCALEGTALMWSGQHDAARGTYEAAADFGGRFPDLPSASFALASLSALAAQSGEQTRATDLARQALRLVKRAALEQYATSVLAYAVAARSALRSGDPTEARELLGQAHAKRPLLSSALPLVSVQTLLEMATAEIELANIANARELVREAATITDQRSVGVLEERCRELKDLLATMPTGQVGAATLTNAELRLLPLLVTHLSFPEIGERLYVSRHTVKSQAMSIYRKLGASTRSEAVTLAREMHLLED